MEDFLANAEKVSGEMERKNANVSIVGYAIGTKLFLRTVLIDKSFLVAKRWKVFYSFNIFLSTPLGAFQG